MHSDSTPVTTTLVDDAHRLQFLPRYFGRAMLTFEDAVYAHMRRLCPSYSGGF